MTVQRAGMTMRSGGITVAVLLGFFSLLGCDADDVIDFFDPECGATEETAVPPQPIARISTGPFVVEETVRPVGTFTFTKR